MTISENAVNTAASDAPITVNLDGTSKWVVTGNHRHEPQRGRGRARSWTRTARPSPSSANGKTVVTGDSEYTVTVTGSYGTTVTTSDANALSTTASSTAQRFDSYYAVSTLICWGQQVGLSFFPSAPPQEE
jgi:hypothetical protein